MGFDAWTTLAVTILMVLAMVRNMAGPDMIMLGGLSLLLAVGVLTPEQAFLGFANTGMLTVAVLFVVAAGVQETGGLDVLISHMLGAPTSLRGAQARLMLPVSLVSAFMNNTPVVAMMLPVVSDWSRRVGISPSKLFIPLSYASIVGGTCTLIGTSTNLVVYGMATTHVPDLEIGMFEIAWLGVPVAIATFAYVLIASPYLLASRGSRDEKIDKAREFTVAMRVEAASPIVGKTIEAAGLRQLPGLYLIEIEREDSEVRPAPGPNVRLRANDRLLFAGVIDSVVDLQKIRGLIPAEQQVNKLAEPRPNRRLVEAVVAAGSSLAMSNIRDSRFRTRFHAAIIAVHRQGERISSKIGDIVPQPGDTLLLDTHPGFIESHRNDPTFALVSEVANSTPRRHDRAWVANALLAAMVVASAAGWLPLLTAAMLAAGLMIVTRCISAEDARRAVDLRVLLTIAAAFGIGEALARSGAAGTLAADVVTLARPFGPVGLLTAVYVVTTLLTSVLTNNACAVLMFPIVLEVCRETGLDFKPFMYVLMLAASASFATPIGYQTNLMVYGPGRYRFSDFTRFGLPLQLLVAAVTVSSAVALWF